MSACMEIGQLLNLGELSNIFETYSFSMVPYKSTNINRVGRY